MIKLLGGLFLIATSVRNSLGPVVYLAQDYEDLHNPGPVLFLRILA